VDTEFDQEMLAELLDVGKRSVTWRAISAPVAVMPMKMGPAQARIAPEVFSPSAVWASSQITIV
jgi:hypothetical protein